MKAVIRLIEDILSSRVGHMGDHDVFCTQINADQVRDVYAKLVAKKDLNPVECKLWEVDLYENWMKVKVPQEVMDDGFHAGTVSIDFSGVQ